MHHAEEVLDVVLPANHSTAEVMQPSKKSLHSPTPTIAPQGTATLSRFLARAAMRPDHLDAIAVGQISIQAVTVRRALSPINRVGRVSRRLRR